MSTKPVELENNAWTLVGDKSASVVKNSDRVSVWLAAGSTVPDFRMGGNPLMTNEIINVELSEGESLYAFARASSGSNITRIDIVRNCQYSSPDQTLIDCEVLLNDG